ncbi:TraB/GumN family protein [Segetibacter sp. 3557_3]|uniref:TraB/GumN family protein n=1 Tax=Segetibacter sp. 3557_3 TaxID=2547429 RepID=UPI001058DE15|nr:TraB/GumN family protein [Segetibacter sp. 3557_3]TDH28917.1 TraB/GumN family protein [Segetibacter sp. 3557_3]
MLKALLNTVFAINLAILCNFSPVQSQAQSLLWEVSGKGLQQPSYLFGTMHIMCKADLTVPDVVRQKVTAAKQVIMEIDLDDPGMMKDMMTGMLMKDSSLDQFMSAGTFDSVSTIFQKSAGLPLQMMKKVKPILLLPMIYPSIMQCQPEGWEKVFQELATEQNKEIKGLETILEQMKVIESIPHAEQVQMFTSSLFNLDSLKTELNKLIAVYKTKDINKVYELTTSSKDFDMYESQMLTTRNIKWIPVMVKEATAMPTFFAFGAAHMGGKTGVIELLRKQGFTVKPINYN